jgi:hypothetical protein
MGWMDKVKQTAAQAAVQAGDMAQISKLKMETHGLTGKMEENFKVIGAKVYDLFETGTKFPEEISTLCKTADGLAAQIKAKEAEIERVKGKR